MELDCENVKVYPIAVIDIDDTAKLLVQGELHIGYNQLQGGHAETFLKLQKEAVFEVNGRFRMFYNSTIQIFPKGHLIVGDSYLNSDSIIACSHKIMIGNGVAIARGVKIYDSDHHMIMENGVQTNNSKAVIIRDHVWIGVNAVILKGVEIGEGSIVAAGSVVINDVPAHSMVAGVPARVIKKEVEWK